MQKISPPPLPLLDAKDAAAIKEGGGRGKRSRNHRVFLLEKFAYSEGSSCLWWWPRLVEEEEEEEKGGIVEYDK